MIIRTDRFSEFNIKTATVTIDKISWTKILTKTSVDRRFNMISFLFNGDGFVNMTPNEDGSDFISFSSDTTLISKEFNYYNGDIYAKLSDDSTIETLDIKVQENDK